MVLGSIAEIFAFNCGLVEIFAAIGFMVVVVVFEVVFVVVDPLVFVDDFAAFDEVVE
jgi:hypothetical protein